MSATLRPVPASDAATATNRAHPGATAGRRGPILLACDGTGQSSAPVVAARLLAERLGVGLEVVTVLEPDLMYGVVIGGGVAILLPDVEDARRAHRVDAVQNYIARFSGGAAPPPMHIRFGTIADEIAVVARERAATLVVVGASPHQRLNRIIGGERAVQVLRSWSCPVLSVPPGFAALPRKIVVGVDFAPASMRAAQLALSMLADGGTLNLVHVLPPLPGDRPLRGSDGHNIVDDVRSLFSQLRDELRAYVPARATIETSVRPAEAVEGIVLSAESLDADLIALGTHGPRLLERLFVGSVASSVMHVAPQAVLVVPPPSPGEALEFWLRMTGTASTNRPREWEAALDNFTRRHSGQHVSIEIDEPALGTKVMGRGYALNGVTYDPHDHRVEIMVGNDAEPLRHLMHSIPHVESIDMTTDDDGHEVLELRHGRGHTLVLVDPR
jgi:nucleotide-binding universal stress UspA family protein